MSASASMLYGLKSVLSVQKSYLFSVFLWLHPANGFGMIFTISASLRVIQEMGYAWHKGWKKVSSVAESRMEVTIIIYPENFDPR